MRKIDDIIANQRLKNDFEGAMASDYENNFFRKNCKDCEFDRAKCLLGEECYAQSKNCFSCVDFRLMESVGKFKDYYLPICKRFEIFVGSDDACNFFIRIEKGGKE